MLSPDPRIDPRRWSQMSEARRRQIAGLAPRFFAEHPKMPAIKVAAEAAPQPVPARPAAERDADLIVAAVRRLAEREERASPAAVAVEAFGRHSDHYAAKTRRKLLRMVEAGTLQARMLTNGAIWDVRVPGDAFVPMAGLSPAGEAEGRRILEAAANAAGVSAEQARKGGYGGAAAAAAQVAAWWLRTRLDWPYTRIADVVGRERTTVIHSARAVAAALSCNRGRPVAQRLAEVARALEQMEAGRC